MSDPTLRYLCYEPRVTEAAGLVHPADYDLKLWVVRLADRSVEPALQAAAWQRAAETLPQPAVQNGRPGLGFAILHLGRTGDYFVLAWWDNENELPIRVFVREGQDWRAARDGEGACVWDLEVVWAERQAYVATVLAGEGRDAYLRHPATGSRAREAPEAE